MNIMSMHPTFTAQLIIKDEAKCLSEKRKALLISDMSKLGTQDDAVMITTRKSSVKNSSFSKKSNYKLKIDYAVKNMKKSKTETIDLGSYNKHADVGAWVLYHFRNWTVKNVTPSKLKLEFVLKKLKSNNSRLLKEQSDLEKENIKLDKDIKNLDKDIKTIEEKRETLTSDYNRVNKEYAKVSENYDYWDEQRGKAETNRNIIKAQMEEAQEGAYECCANSGTFGGAYSDTLTFLPV